MDVAILTGLLIGIGTSLLLPFLSLEQIVGSEAHYRKYPINRASFFATVPIAVTPILIVLVLWLTKPDSGDTIVAGLIMSFVVLVVGWPLTFFVSRRAIAKKRANLAKNDEDQR